MNTHSMRGRGDVHGNEILEYVDTNVLEVFYMDQKAVLIKMYNIWGNTACVDGILNVTMNNRLRVFGIIALENCGFLD